MDDEAVADAIRRGIATYTELQRLAAIGREIEWEIDRYGDPLLMGIVARVECGDGFTQ